MSKKFGRSTSSWARIIWVVFLLVTSVLTADALMGDEGFMTVLRVRRQQDALEASIDALKRENARLCEDVLRLRDDPRTVEAVARQELGMIRPGEIVFLINDMSGAERAPVEPARSADGLARR